MDAYLVPDEKAIEGECKSKYEDSVEESGPLLAQEKDKEFFADF